jgi:lipoprotein-anchoring transpeptidase ErfK/SrfK
MTMRLGALAALALGMAAMGQTPEPVTRVAPAASPAPEMTAPAMPPSGAASPLPALPETAVAPAGSATPSATAATTTPAPAATPEATPVATPAAMSGTQASAGGSTPAVSGTEATPSPTPPNPYSIEIDLHRQRVFLLKDGKMFSEAPISSGRAGHLTPTGNFSVIEKDPNHFSNLYGKIVEKDSGRTVKAGADFATPVPKGCKFVPAPMKWFMRFDGATGMHAGILPGYAASHGCVRMPLSKAELFYNTVSLGTPVHVFGDPPVRESHEETEAPHARVAAAQNGAHAAPASTPKQKHGWWIF